MASRTNASSAVSSPISASGVLISNSKPVETVGFTSGGIGGILSGGAGSSAGSSSQSSSSSTTGFSITSGTSCSRSVTVNSISGSAASTGGGANATTPLSSFSTFPLPWLNSSSTNNFAPAPFFPLPFSGFTGASTGTGTTSGTGAFSLRAGILKTGLNLQIKCPSPATSNNAAVPIQPKKRVSHSLIISPTAPPQAKPLPWVTNAKATEK